MGILILAQYCLRHPDAGGGIELLTIYWLTILKLSWAKDPVTFLREYVQEYWSDKNGYYTSNAYR